MEWRSLCELDRLNSVLWTQRLPRVKAAPSQTLGHRRGSDTINSDLVNGLACQIWLRECMENPLEESLYLPFYVDHVIYWSMERTDSGNDFY